MSTPESLFFVSYIIAMLSLVVNICTYNLRVNDMATNVGILWRIINIHIHMYKQCASFILKCTKNSYNSLINVSFVQRKKDRWEKNLYICVVLRAKILATASKSKIKWRLLRGRRQTWGVDSTKGVIFRLVSTIKRLFEWPGVKKLVAFICRMCANVNKKQMKSISNFTVC